MRAKTVNFERGGDPKKAMGLGREATYQKIADMMEADGWTPSDPHESDNAAGWAVDRGHHDLVKFIIDNDRPNNFDSLVQWASINRDSEMVELLLSYYPRLEKIGFAIKMADPDGDCFLLLTDYIRDGSGKKERKKLE
jgi:hypothetical protein